MKKSTTHYKPTATTLDINLCTTSTTLFQRRVGNIISSTTISWFAQWGAFELQNIIIKSMRKRTPTASAAFILLLMDVEKGLWHILLLQHLNARKFPSIRPDHFAAHGLRRGSATHVTTASPPSLASLASLALGGRWLDYHSTQCRPSQQYPSNAGIIIEANSSVPRPAPALVTALPHQRWQRQGHLPSKLQSNQRKQQSIRRAML